MKAKTILAAAAVFAVGAIWAEDTASVWARATAAAGTGAEGREVAAGRRIAVVNFRISTGDSISWNGMSESSAMWAKALESRLSERITQTRKFTVVDRKFDAEINNELARLIDANAAPSDAVRKNCRMVTDYLVVGEIKFHAVQPPAVNPLSGQVTQPSDQRFAEINYRVLNAPTGQLMWSDTITLNSGSFPAASIAEFASESADGAAAIIVDGIMASTLPLEIVGKTEAGLLVIGEGGKSVAEGEVFTVFSLGEKVRDSRTGEVIDEIEDAVGDVMIVRVTPKASYAKFLGGDLSKMVPGARLRRPSAANFEMIPGTIQGAATPDLSAPGAAAPGAVIQDASMPGLTTPGAAVPGATIRRVGNGGIVTPF